MPGLADVLKNGGGPMGPPMPDQMPEDMPPEMMGPPPDEGAGPEAMGGGEMQVEDAIGIMEQFGIPPDALPVIAQAVITLIEAGAMGGGGGGEEMPPPEGDMPPEGEMPPGPPPGY